MQGTLEVDEPRYLFLDIDGVLQTPKKWDFVEMEFAGFLAQALDATANVRVVVSSSHREGKTLPDLRLLFPPCLARHIYGATPVRSDGRGLGGRQREVEQWISEQGFAGRYLAVDDEAHLFDPGCSWLLMTNPLEGLQGRTRQLLQHWIASPDVISQQAPAHSYYPRRATPERGGVHQ